MEYNKQPLTADEIKEIIAKEKGYIDWESCINAQPNYNVEHLMDEVLLRFASSQTKPLLEEIAKLKEEKAHIIKQFQLLCEIIRTDKHPNNLKNN